MTDDMIPELQLGYARLGGYKAAATLANLNAVRDASSAWLVSEHRSGLIRNLSSQQVLDEFGEELEAIEGKAMTVDKLSRGGWWKKVVKLPRSAPLVQAYNSEEFRGLDLGRAFITHRGQIAPATVALIPASP